MHNDQSAKVKPCIDNIPIIQAILLVISFVLLLAGCTGAGISGSESKAGPVTGEDFLLDTECSITIYGMRDVNDISKSSDMKKSEGGTGDASTENSNGDKNTEGAAAEEDKANTNDSENTDNEFEKRANDVISDTFAEARRYEKLLSKTIKTSDIYRINHAGGKWTEVSTDTVGAIKAGIEYGDISEGEYDITIGKVMDLWEFHEGEPGYGTLPKTQELKNALKHVNYKRIAINGRKVRLSSPQAEIDIGGIAKGWISDRLAEYMREKGVTSAIINLGGNIVCIGTKPAYSKENKTSVNGESKLSIDAGTDFRIGIRDPFNRSEIAEKVSVRDSVVITSGTYERYFDNGGRRYHHIIDPETGYPVKTNVASVTVVASAGHGADADATATALIIAAKRGTVKRSPSDKADGNRNGDIKTDAHKSGAEDDSLENNNNSLTATIYNDASSEIRASLKERDAGAYFIYIMSDGSKEIVR